MPLVSLSRSTALVLVSALVALLVVAGDRLSRTGTASAPEVVAPLEPVPPGEAAPSRAELVVHVVGAVRRPGLYRLREGARVADALARAGGASRRADLAALNLAAPLVDGVQVLVPARLPTSGAPGPAPPRGAGEAAPGSPTAASGAKISLATATVEQLDELPGVGPVTAENIVSYRSEHGPFRSVEELDAVPGIGPARIEQLRELVTP